MTFMFSNAQAFNGDLSSWDVASVTNMASMFQNAQAFTGDLSSWNVAKVTNMHVRAAAREPCKLAERHRVLEVALIHELLRLREQGEALRGWQAGWTVLGDCVCPIFL